jgi:pyruvate kinase
LILTLRRYDIFSATGYRPLTTDYLEFLMRRTKIVCTIGPATSSEAELRGLIRAGMNLARLNFSHGTHAEHRRVIHRLRKVSREMGVVVGILQDLCGPKLRVGKLIASPLTLRRGGTISLVAHQEAHHEMEIPITWPEALAHMRAGEHVLLDDGRIELQVTRPGTDVVECKVIRGGELTDGKGINLPGLRSEVESFTAKDRADLAFGIAEGVDWVAMSFIRRASDLAPLREEMQMAGQLIPIIAKIEKPQAIEHLEEIIASADGVMVARGDLGVEMPLERVPLLQKEIIARCTRAGKPAIVATQMLESMTHAPRPTRAEVSDVANAILDGADALMLSGETAVGEYPMQAVEVMDRVARQTEKNLDYVRLLRERSEMPCATVTDAICQACGQIAEDLQVAAIITPTSTGHTAAMISRLRPAMPIIAITSSHKTLQRLSLWWGVRPFHVKRMAGTDTMVRIALDVAKDSGLVKTGARVVITAGMPPGIAGRTNLIKVESV